MSAPLQISQSATLLTPPPSTLSYLYRGLHFLGSLSFSVRYDVVVKDSNSVEITGTGQSLCLLWALFPPCLSYSLPKETHSFRLSARVFFHCLWVVSMGHICRESDNKTNRSNNLFCHSPVPQAAVWQCLLSST